MLYSGQKQDRSVNFTALLDSITIPPPPPRHLALPGKLENVFNILMTVKMTYGKHCNTLICNSSKEKDREQARERERERERERDERERERERERGCESESERERDERERERE